MWFSEFEGRADGKSVKNILKLVKPRNLIVVHGNTDSTKHLVDFCDSDPEMAEYMSKKLSPSVGERVDVTSERNIFQLKLTDSLVSSLKFSEVHGYSIAWVNGVIANPADDAGADGDDGAANTTVATGDDVVAAMEEDTPDIGIPMLTAPAKKNLAGHSAVFIGDIRLSNLRSVLEQNGIKAHFSGGALICNDTVAVRKEDGKPFLSLEGNVCETYYAVRELLYDQFAIV
jgi:cleavage and polyadenylation specificity factor subunit 2